MEAGKPHGTLLKMEFDVFEENPIAVNPKSCFKPIINISAGRVKPAVLTGSQDAVKKNPRRLTAHAAGYIINLKS